MKKILAVLIASGMTLSMFWGTAAVADTIDNPESTEPPVVTASPVPDNDTNDSTEDADTNSEAEDDTDAKTDVSNSDDADVNTDNETAGNNNDVKSTDEPKNSITASNIQNTVDVSLSPYR